MSRDRCTGARIEPNCEVQKPACFLRWCTGATGAFVLLSPVGPLLLVVVGGDLVQAGAFSLLADGGAFTRALIGVHERIAIIARRVEGFLDRPRAHPAN